ncbi:glycosyltransferase family 2 protein [soil metagenome]
MHKIAVIIPAYNEEASIAAVVEEVHLASADAGLYYWPVVINDCSKDRTGQIISELACTALQLPINLGIGGAVQTGFKFALLNGFTHAVQVDGDGQHPPAELQKLYHHMQQSGCDVVVGSRFLEKTGFQSSAMRRFGIQYFMRLNKLLVGATVHDSTSGLRMLNQKALAVVSKDYPDEYPEPEAVILYVKNGLKIGEVQVQMRERQGGVSSIDGVRSIYYMAKVTIAILYTYIRLTFR